MAKLEKLETNKIKLTFEITKAELEEGKNKAYNENKSKITIPGFRKGKAPRKVVENFYGKDFFLKDGLNNCVPEVYEKEIKEHKLEVVSAPSFNIEELMDDNNIVITAEVYTKPELSIEDYRGITYPKFEMVVTESEINSEIDKDRKKNARIISVIDRPVNLNDTVVIDFEGFIDGVPFEGGKGEGYELKIGSNTFIDTFEEQLISHGIGEEVDVNVNFPADYGKEELQNKPALFKVKIVEINYEELPEADDDFAQDVSDFETFEQYKNNIRENLLKNKDKDAKIAKENNVFDKLIEKAVVELPEVMVENQINNLVEDFSRRISDQGLNMEVYLQYLGQTLEQFREQHRVSARKQVLMRLILEKVSIIENFEVAEEEFEKELNNIAQGYGMQFEDLKKVLRPEDKDGIYKDIKTQKAFDLIMDSAIEE